MLNLDTHIFIHALAGNLNNHERRVLTDDSEWSLSAIVLWEIEKLFQKGRLTHGLDSPSLVPALRRIHVWPITSEICLNLRNLDFRSDPADELIAATSLTHNIALVTRDRRIRVSKLIRCV